MIECPVCNRKNVKQDKCPGCGTDLTSILQLKELPLLYYNEGVILYNECKYDEAIEKFITAISLDNNVIDFYIALGSVYNTKKQYSEAIIQFDKALKIDPDNIDTINGKKESEENILKEEREKKKDNLIRILLPSILILMFVLIIFYPKFQRKPIKEMSEKIKIELQNNKYTKQNNLKVIQGDTSIIISGQVPTNQSKEVVKLIANNITKNVYIDVTKIAVINKITYTIKRGDNLYLLARRLYKNGDLWINIYELNKDFISDPRKLQVGDIILLPTNKK